MLNIRRTLPLAQQRLCGRRSVDTRHIDALAEHNVQRNRHLHGAANRIRFYLYRGRSNWRRKTTRLRSDHLPGVERLDAHISVCSRARVRLLQETLS